MCDNTDLTKPIFIRKNSSLHVNQIRTVNVLRGESRIKSLQARPILIERLKKMGYDEEVVDKIEAYLKNVAPIITHFHPKNILNKLLSDTHFRSLFEIGTGSGSTSIVSRNKWEKEIFLDLYTSCTAFERPKYGCFNILNNPAGVIYASAYGDSYLVFKDHVRIRATIADGDTSVSRLLGVTDYCLHIVNNFGDQELLSVINIVNNEIPYGEYILSKYKEIQIHGEIKLDTDIETIAMNSLHKGTAQEEEAIEFAAKNNCKLEWF